jgi:uncharacterized protein YgiM (DUF1202 family)
MEYQQGKSRLSRLSDEMDQTNSQQSHTGEEPTKPTPIRPVPIYKQQAVVRQRSLHVRRDHSLNADTVGTLKSGDTVTILETWSDGRDTWARIGDGRWALMKFNGQPYIELT